MIASFFEFNSCSTVVACLPTLVFRELDELSGTSILGAFARAMPFVAAESTDFRSASFTDTILAAMRSPSTCVNFRMGRPQPFSATLGWTWYAIFHFVHLMFFVPFRLEF